MSQNYHPSIRYSQFWNISIHPVKVQFISDLFVDISSIKINIAFIGSGDSHNYCILIRWFNFNFFAACATVCKRYQKMEYYYVSHDTIIFLAPAWFHDPTYFPLANWLIIRWILLAKFIIRTIVVAVTFLYYGKYDITYFSYGR